MTSIQTSLDTVEVDGIKIFYRSAGAPSNPVLLLLHGFPASSFQFRNLIPLLSHRYRLIAPDLPGYGFTTVPKELNYEYKFDNLATTIEAFVDALELKSFAIYVFDFGAPVGFRLASRRPSQITAIITQNGNAYDEGLSKDFFAPLQKFWASSPLFDSSLASQEAKSLLPFLSLGPTQWQYTTGVPSSHAAKIDPAAYTLDAALMQREGQDVIQLSLFFDYQSNVALYPKWQEYFRKENPRLLAMWGKNDPVFVKEGAEAFKKDMPNAEVVFVDSGHFSLETHVEEFATKIDEFLRK